MNQFSLHLLGGFALYQGDRRVDLPPASQRLVALVALKRRPLHRLWICAMLWPHAQTHRAVANLRSVMWRLRPAGAEALLSVDPQRIWLGANVVVDWHRVVDGVEQVLDGDADPQLAADVLPLLRTGELLDGWAERWLIEERDLYHRMRRRALDDVINHTHDEPMPVSVSVERSER